MSRFSATRPLAPPGPKSRAAAVRRWMRIITSSFIGDDRAQMVTQICMEANPRSSISGNFGCSVLSREQRNQGVGAQAVSENAQNNRAGDGRG